MGNTGGPSGKEPKPSSKILGFNQHHLACCLVTFFVSCAVYANGIHGDFVFDDKATILGNRDVVLPEGGWFDTNVFFNDFWGEALHLEWSNKSYRPFTTLTFRLSFFLHDAWPRGWKVENVIIHAASSSMFYVMSTALFDGWTQCIIAGLLFATHPIHTEAVSNITGRAEPLCGMFFFLSLWMYIRSTQAEDSARCRAWGLLAGSMTCMVVSALCKETGITAAGIVAAYEILICWDICGCRKSHQKANRAGSAARMCVVAITAATFLKARSTLAGGTLAPALGPGSEDLHRLIDNPISYERDLLKRYLSYFYLHSRYAWLMIFPKDLSADYSYPAVPVIDGWHDPRNMNTIALYVTMLGAVLFWLYKRLPLHLFFFATMLGPFVPASNIIFPVGTTIAERLLYLPSAGYCLLIALLLSPGDEVPRRTAAKWLGCLVAAVIVCAYSYRTVLRNPEWDTEYQLFNSAVKVVPDSAKAQGNLATQLVAAGAYDLAYRHYQIALDLHPTYYSTYYNFAVLLEKVGMMQQAVDYYKKSIELKPIYTSAYINLANIYSRQAQFDESIPIYKKALEIDEKSHDVNINLGISYFSQTELLAGSQREKVLREALKRFQIAKDNLMPLDSKSTIWYYMGLCYERLVERERAIECYKEALLANDGEQASMSANNAGVILNSMGRFKEATPFFEEALSRNPKYALAHFNYGVSLFNIEKYAGSAKAFTKAIYYEPAQAEAYLYLAISLRNAEGRSHYIGKTRPLVNVYSLLTGDHKEVQGW